MSSSPTARGIRAFLLIEAGISAMLMLIGACSPGARYRLLTTFVDGVPPYPEWLSPKPAPPRKPARSEIYYTQPAALVKLVAQPNLTTRFAGKRPDVERLSSYQQVAAALPKSSAGTPDWDAALAQGAVAPESSLEKGRSGLDAQDLDVQLKGAMPVTFPHGPHTKWLACDNCHTGIFEMTAGAATMTMRDLTARKYCGVCHGTVAFGLQQCGRCHAKLDTETDLDVTLKGDMGVKFPHAPHTRWLPCETCHNDVFPMQAGATAMTMRDLSQGRFCGSCHGSMTFGLTECGRCHQAKEPTDLDVTLKGDMGVKFPHAPHTTWLPCESCHTKIFPTSGGATTMHMADFAKGKYCGACHGSIAFDMTRCERCHAAREVTDLDVQLKGAAPVTFAHAQHTRLLPCEACHTKLFPMAAGSTEMTMDDLGKGKYCGACHGKVAFALDQCAKCHPEMG